jgi:hypothetical protein
MSRWRACEDLHRIKECFRARKGYSFVMKVACGQVCVLRGLIYTRITKKPLAALKHPKTSSTIDAAAGLCESGTKKLRPGQVRRAHYRFLRASYPVRRVGAWCPVTLFGLSTEGSCALNWAWVLVLPRKRLLPFRKRQFLRTNLKRRGCSCQPFGGIRLIVADCLQPFDCSCTPHLLLTCDLCTLAIYLRRAGARPLCVLLQYISGGLARGLYLGRPPPADDGMSVLEITCGMLSARLIDRLIVRIYRGWTRPH